MVVDSLHPFPDTKSAVVRIAIGQGIPFPTLFYIPGNSELLETFQQFPQAVFVSFLAKYTSQTFQLCSYYIHWSLFVAGAADVVETAENLGVVQIGLLKV